MEVDLRGLRVKLGWVAGFAVDRGDQVRAHYPENLRIVAARTIGMHVGSSTALRREATNETTTFKSSDKNSDRYLFLGGEIGLIRRSELPAAF